MNQNTLTMTGTVVYDPELRFTASGVAVCNLKIAHNPRKKVNGEWTNGDPIFMPVSLWRDMAEHVAQSVRKGDLVLVTGTLAARSYEKDGVTVTVIECEATDVAVSLQWADVEIARTERTTRVAIAAPKALHVPDEEEPF